LLDENARTDTYPTIRVEENQTEVGHEATVSKVGDDQLFYLMSRGLDESEAYSLIVNGFIEPIIKELPMEYAVELNRLIQLEMSGSVCGLNAGHATNQQGSPLWRLLLVCSQSDGILCFLFLA